MANLKGGKPVISYEQKTINASQTDTLISIDSTYFNSVSFIVTITDATANKVKRSDVAVVLKNASPDHTELLIGDTINSVIDVDLDSGNIRLLLTNNESNSLTADIVTIKF